MMIDGGGGVVGLEKEEAVDQTLPLVWLYIMMPTNSKRGLVLRLKGLIEQSTSISVKRVKKCDRVRDRLRVAGRDRER